MRFLLDEEPEVRLVYDQNVSVPLPALRQLVPELADEPLSNPLPGRLRVVFTLQ